MLHGSSAKMKRFREVIWPVQGGYMAVQGGYMVIQGGYIPEGGGYNRLWVGSRYAYASKKYAFKNKFVKINLLWLQHFLKSLPPSDTHTHPKSQ